MGTFGVIGGTYVNVNNFIRYALDPNGDRAVTYHIYRVDSATHEWKSIKFHSMRGDMSEWDKKRFAAHKVELDGESAIVTGTNQKFAHIKSHTKSIEFAWNTVAWICATKQGKFNS